MKTSILEVAKEYELDVTVELIDHVDNFLYDKKNVITGDSVILDNCISWINLYKMIIDGLEDIWIIKLI